MTSCKNFRELINLYLDNEANDEQIKTLFSHLQECPGCYQKLEEAKGLHSTIKSIPVIKLPQGFHNQIMDSLQKVRNKASQPVGQASLLVMSGKDAQPTQKYKFLDNKKKSHFEILRPAMNLTGIVATIMLVIAIAWNIYTPESAIATPEIYIVSPIKEAVVDRQYVDISAAFNDIDTKKIRVILDNKDVTEATEINQEFLIYTSDNLRSGYHIATIQIMDNKGAPVIQRSWAFYVIPSEPA